MKLIFSLTLVLCLQTAFANNYYFSSSSGDDSRSFSQAQNSSTPWKSINKLNAIFSSLQPGDNVYFKRGETFYGSIVITKSGTGSSKITISAYGSGSKPVMTTLQTLSSWTANSSYSGVYESSVSSTAGNVVNIVLLNDIQKGMGRYPNPDKPEKGYLTVDSHAGTTSITDGALPSSPNWKDAEIVIRPNRWMMDRYKILSHSGSTLIFDNSTTTPPKDGFGYFIQNSVKTLDQLGEWYYNPLTKKISMYFGSAKPSSYKVQVATYDHFVFSSSNSNVVIDNLDFQGANDDGIDINSGSNMVVQNCDITASGSDGVNASGTGFKIENCSVTGSYNDGIAVARGTSAVVRNNTVRNTYYIPGMGPGGNGKGAGIRNSDLGLIEYNRVYNSGYIAIQIGGDNSVIKNNLIDTFGFIKDDGGGMYTSNGHNDTYKGRKIIGNIILNGIGAPDGANSPNSSADGIYLDDNVNGIEITDNTIANCNKSIYLHNTRNILLRNNTFYNSVNGQLYMKHDYLGDPIRNNNIMNNIFFSKELKHVVSSVSSVADDIDQFGKMDSNYYARPIDNGTVIYNSYRNSSGNTITGNYDLPSWKNLYAYDKNSKKSAKEIAPYTLKGIVGSNKYAAGSFSSSGDVKKVWPNSCDLFWANSGVLDGGYIKVVPTAIGSSIVVTLGALSSSKAYLLKYSVKGTGTTSMSAYLRSSDYHPLTDSKYWTVGTSRQNNEMLFIPSKNESNGSLVFTVDAKQTYYIDNIQLYEANATATNPDDSIRFVYNASQSSKTISLNGNYVDVKNNKFSGSISLKPYESAVLISNGGTITSTNASPKVSITSPSSNVTFNDPSDIKIGASATDADGSITKVEFYNGSTLIQTEKMAPYDWVWTQIAAGNYTITAKAFDNSGNVTTSSAVSFSVGSGTVPKPGQAAPTINITSPAANATYASSANIQLAASASDDGSITKVEFYNGSKLLATEKYAPYSWTWSNVPSGTYTITAKATDNDGNATTSKSVSLTVGGGNPTVTITNPIVNASYSGPTSIRLTAAANDANGTIRKVEFYNGSTLIATENYYPYDWIWPNVQPGNYLLTAKAVDNDGNTTTSSQVPITVSNTDAPVVIITSPVLNATYSTGSSVQLTATASDAGGYVTKVQFYAGSTLIATELNAPYNWTWKNVQAGSYKIIAKATDNSGKSTTSAPISITVGSTSLTTAVTGDKTAAPMEANATNQAVNDLGFNTSDFKLYPNPAKDKINLGVGYGFHTNEKVIITIRNTIGSIVKRESVTLGTNVSVNVSALSAGTYILTISNDTFTSSKKFLKAR